MKVPRLGVRRETNEAVINKFMSNLKAIGNSLKWGTKVLENAMVEYTGIHMTEWELHQEIENRQELQ